VRVAATARPELALVGVARRHARHRERERERRRRRRSRDFLSSKRSG
jgi:hypothetical protein